MVLATEPDKAMVEESCRDERPEDPMLCQSFSLRRVLMALTQACRLEGAAVVEWCDNLDDRKCAHCYQALTPPVVYRDGEWYHARCFTDGARQLRNATRLAQALDETPSGPSASTYPP